MLGSFHTTGDIPIGLNSSFIALIPKIHKPTVSTDFRPISLINSTMKILLKMLENRLKTALPLNISEEQYGFMPRKRISDAILITSEVIHFIKAKKCNGVILKLDFEKVFDTVNWDFLLDVLRHMNFSPRWIRWTKSIFDNN